MSTTSVVSNNSVYQSGFRQGLLRMKSHHHKGNMSDIPDSSDISDMASSSSLSSALDVVSGGGSSTGTRTSGGIVDVMA